MHLVAYLRLFQRTSFRIYFSDHLFDPDLSMSVLEDCFKFLGLLPLKAVEMESILQLKYNIAPQQEAARTFSAPVTRSIQRAMYPWNSALATFLGSPLPVSWHYAKDISPARKSHGPSKSADAAVANKSMAAAVFTGQLHHHEPLQSKVVETSRRRKQVRKSKAPKQWGAPKTLWLMRPSGSLKKVTSRNGPLVAIEIRIINEVLSDQVYMVLPLWPEMLIPCLEAWRFQNTCSIPE